MMLLPDVLEHVDDSQECGDRHDLRPVEFDALTLGVELGQPRGPPGIC